MTALLLLLLLLLLILLVALQLGLLLLLLLILLLPSILGNGNELFDGDSRAIDSPLDESRLVASLPGTDSNTLLVATSLVAEFAEFVEDAKSLLDEDEAEAEAEAEALLLAFLFLILFFFLLDDVDAAPLALLSTGESSIAAT